MHLQRCQLDRKSMHPNSSNFLMHLNSSFSKVTYVTAFLPYVLIIVLLIRGITLPGALDGLKFYLLPDFAKLADIKVI